MIRSAASESLGHVALGVAHRCDLVDHRNARVPARLPCSGPESVPTAAESAAPASAPVEAAIRAVNVDALRPCSAVQIQYVSIAVTWRRNGLAVPAEEELLRGARPAGDDVVGNRVGVTVGDACRPRHDRHHLRRESTEVVSGLFVRYIGELAEPPDARQTCDLGLCIGRSIPGEPRGLVGLRLRHPWVEAPVDEQPPDLLVRHLPDELLDVDAAIPQRTALAIGLGDLGLDRDDAFEPRLEVGRLGHPHGRYLTGIP